MKLNNRFSIFVRIYVRVHFTENQFHNNYRYPIFSLAYGEETSFNFLRKLALSNSGFAKHIYIASDTSLQLKNFYKQIASPQLSNVSFAYIPGEVSKPNNMG